MLLAREFLKLPGIRHGFCAEPASAPSNLWRPRQVHGSEVASVDSPDSPRPDADGALTSQQALPIGVVTADCVPLLFFSPQQNLVAAVHAGWRGLAAGILERTLGRFGPDRAELRIAIGPAASGCCYEVGEEVLDALRLDPSETTPTRPGHARIDLRRVASERLRNAGCDPERIERVGPCTICSGEWPSYRRQGAAAERIYSWIELV